MEDVYIHRRFFILGIFCVGLAGLLCGLLAGYGLGYHKGRESLIGGSAVSTDTIRDTVKVVVPRATDSIRMGTIRVPVVIPMTEPEEPRVPKAGVEVFEPDSLFGGSGSAAAKQQPTEPSANDKGREAKEKQEREAKEKQEREARKREQVMQLRREADTLDKYINY